MNNTNNFTAEQAFQKARALFTRAMRDKFANDADCENWVNGLKLSQSEIRLECELNAVNTNFRFGLTDNQSNSTNFRFITENRLTMQDSLVCNEYGIYVGNPSSRTDLTWQLKTYGNPNDFAAADALAINETLYSHGNFRLTCNNDVVIPYRQVWNHLYKPQTQQTAALGAASPDDQIRGAEDGMITMQPNLLLIGSKGYIPEIVLPAALNSVTNPFERVILIFRGVLAQNSTSVS